MKINVSDKIVDSLIQVGVVPLEDKALYAYGVRQGIFMVINLMTTIFIGLMVGMVWQSIIFILAYIPIRSYAGGYHASSPLTCYLLSIPFMTAALLGVKWIPWNSHICFIALVCSGLIIVFLAPVEDSNKPLDQIEHRAYKRKSCVILIIHISIMILFWLFSMKQTSISIIMADMMAAVMLILGVLKNKINVKEKA